MHTACYALALEIVNDEVLTLLLLGGTTKEKDIPAVDVDVPAEHREAFRAVMNGQRGTSMCAEVRLAQCIDCVYVLSIAAIDLTRSQTVTVINKAEQVILPLLKTLKNEKPERNNAVYLLRYQLLALIEAYKRLL